MKVGWVNGTQGVVERTGLAELCQTMDLVMSLGWGVVVGGQVWPPRVEGLSEALVDR